MKLAAYLRVSTAQQAEEDRFGVPRQRHDMETFIARSRGQHELLVEFLEVASGSNGVAGREAFPDLLCALRDGDVEGVVISDMTRLSRKLTTQEALLAAVWSYGGTVFTADGAEVAQDDPDDPMRTAMRQMAGVFSQLERSMISKRLRDGRKAKARVTPKYAWTFAPAGFEKVGSSLVLDPSAPIWDARARAEALRTEGQSLRAIATVLTTQKATTPSGKSTLWTATQVSRLLSRESLT
jgi:DNA invertase Pin-like site-specific DNA recombinase